MIKVPELDDEKFQKLLEEEMGQEDEERKNAATELLNSIINIGEYIKFCDYMKDYLERNPTAPVEEAPAEEAPAE